MLKLLIPLLLVLAGCSSVTAQEEPSVLSVAYDDCSSLDETGQGLDLADGAHTLILSTEDDGVWGAVICTLDSLGTSEKVVDQIESTTAMMGVRTAEEGGLAYEWTYHPDNGLNMTISDQ